MVVGGSLRSLELCELILTAQLPEHVDVIRTALFDVSVAGRHRSPSPAERSIAKCLMHEGDFDLEHLINPQAHRYNVQWPVNLPVWHAEYLPLVEQNMLWQTPMDPQLKFEFLISCYGDSVTPRMLTSLFPMHGGDQALANLRDSRHGISVLHLVASNLLSVVSMGKGLDEWLDLLERIVAAGADVHRGSTTRCGSVTQRQRYTSIWTPLMTLASSFMSFQPPPYAEQLRVLQSWAASLGRAGTDISQYGNTEARLWSEHGFTDQPPFTFCYFMITTLRHGSMPEDYDLELRNYQQLQVYEMRQTPGAWYSSTSLPRKICWPPGKLDGADGALWNWHRDIIVPSRPRMLSEMSAIRRDVPLDSFHHSWCTVQDDTGIYAAQLCSRASSRHRLRHRRAVTEPTSVRNTRDRPRESMRQWNEAHYLHPEISARRFPYRRIEAWPGEPMIDWQNPRFEDALSAMVRDLSHGIDYEPRAWTGEDMLSAVHKCRQFWKAHGIWPTSCRAWAPNRYRTINDVPSMDPLDAEAVVDRDPEFCEAFPLRWHQTYHLRSRGLPSDVVE